MSIFSIKENIEWSAVSIHQNKYLFIYRATDNATYNLFLLDKGNFPLQQYCWYYNIIMRIGSFDERYPR